MSSQLIHTRVLASSYCGSYLAFNHHVATIPFIQTDTLSMKCHSCIAWWCISFIQEILHWMGSMSFSECTNRTKYYAKLYYVAIDTTQSRTTVSELYFTVGSGGHAFSLQEDDRTVLTLKCKLLLLSAYTEYFTLLVRFSAYTTIFL